MSNTHKSYMWTIFLVISQIDGGRDISILKCTNATWRYVWFSYLWKCNIVLLAQSMLLLKLAKDSLSLYDLLKKMTTRSDKRLVIDMKRIIEASERKEVHYAVFIQAQSNPKYDLKPVGRRVFYGTLVALQGYCTHLMKEPKEIQWN